PAPMVELTIFAVRAGIPIPQTNRWSTRSACSIDSVASSAIGASCVIQLSKARVRAKLRDPRGRFSMAGNCNVACPERHLSLAKERVRIDPKTLQLVSIPQLNTLPLFQGRGAKGK